MPLRFFGRARSRPDPEADTTPQDQPAEPPPREPLTENTTLLPTEILADNLRAVTAALSAEGIGSWLVSDETAVRGVVGIMAEDRPLLERALARLAEQGYWVRLPNKARPEAELATFDLAELVTLSPVLVLFRRYTVPGSTLLIRGDYSCEVELWETSTINGAEYLTAPRENRASRQIAVSEFELVPTTWHGVDALAPSLFLERMLDDVTFPIDMVYTWVDGGDEDWQRRRGLAEAESRGVEFHPEATMASRFADHEELRYSLRSVASYAPWVRTIFLVTDRQVPAWLDAAHPKIRIVDHKEIFPSAEHLPNFNSNAIISSLHHIEGLSEHYIYMNDDVFLGRWVSPEKFFTPSGQAKVAPAYNRRPFGPARLEDEPHLNLTRNMRELLRDRFGITVSRAIRHTPHPQLRSVHQSMESEFLERYEQTRSHPFRHHDDIVADQLFHYYAQIVGAAVAIQLRYEYINLKDSRQEDRLTALLRRRDRDVFCLNDTPVDDVEPFSDQEIGRFLRSYFPLASPFEKRPEAA